MRLKLLFTAILLTNLAVAQTPADNTTANAFEMTKATVEFLATDKKTYGYQAEETCPACVSYQTLEAFIKKNKLTKADELVKDAQKKTSELLTQKKPAKEILIELRGFLLSRVTDGEERKHRFALKSFPAYENRLNQLAGLPQTPTTSAAQTPVSDQEDQEAAPDTLTGESTRGASTPGESTNVSKTKDTDLFSMSTLALLLSLVSLGGVVFLYTRKSKTPDSASLDTKLAQLSDKVFHLEADRKDLVKAVQTLNARLQQLEGQLRTAATPRPVANPPIDPLRSVLEQPMQNAPRPQSAGSIPPPSNNPPSQNTERRPQTADPRISNPERKPQTAERFARTADLGDGFSVGGLLAVAERGTIYQILVEGPQASYRIVDNYDAQQLALSDPYSYLSDACEYLSQPRPGSRIQTDQPGRLTLQGEKWKIEQKAKISFV